VPPKPYPVLLSMIVAAETGSPVVGDSTTRNGRRRAGGTSSFQTILRRRPTSPHWSLPQSSTSPASSPALDEPSTAPPFSNVSLEALCAGERRRALFPCGHAFHAACIDNSPPCRACTLSVGLSTPGCLLAPASLLVSSGYVQSCVSWRSTKGVRLYATERCDVECSLECGMRSGNVGSCIHEFLRVISNEVRLDKFILPLQLPTTLNGLAEQFTGRRQCGYTTL
jgi:hypothetical protein